MKRAIFITSIIIIIIYIIFIQYNNDNYLNIGIDTAYYPMCFEKKNTLVGYEIDMINELCKTNNFKYRLVTVPWGEKFDYLNNGKIDCIISGLTVTEDRKKDVWLSNPYFTNNLGIWIKKNNQQKNSESLDNKIIGIFEKSSSNYAFFDHDYNTQSNKIIFFDQLATACSSLNSGAIDMLVIDDVYIKAIQQTNNYCFKKTNINLGNEKFAIAFKKNLPEKKKQKINNIIKKWNDTEQNKLLLKKWFGDTTNMG